MNAPMSWYAVLDAELAALHGTPPAAGTTRGEDEERLRALHARILERGQSALCLSGGGIRSAAFGLGVLQGLACLGLLGSIDYLSTVSGGGYIGGWFTTWLRRFFWSAYPCQISLRNALLLTSIIPGAGWIVLGAVAPRIWKRRHENDGGSLRVHAVRRIRLDFGIPIVFPQLDLTRAGQGQGDPHGAIGQIRYSVVDGPDAPDGTILYIKATLSGDEPVDVRNFSAMDPTFPHDSTGNQFFDEARFESYRTLGFHSVLSVTDGLPRVDSVQALCDVARTTLAEGASPRVPQRT